MSLRVEIYGDSKLDLAGDLLEEFRREAKDAVRDAATILLAEVRSRLRRGDPEYETGDLYTSFQIINPSVRGSVASSGIKSDDPGVNRVEHGYTDIRGIGTLPHPFVRPGIKAAEGPIHQLLQERLTLEGQTRALLGGRG